MRGIDVSAGVGFGPKKARAQLFIRENYRTLKLLRALHKHEEMVGGWVRCGAAAGGC
jgi:hypothetical protein